MIQKKKKIRWTNLISSRITEKFSLLFPEKHFKKLVSSSESIKYLQNLDKTDKLGVVAKLDDLIIIPKKFQWWHWRANVVKLCKTIRETQCLKSCNMWTMSKDYPYSPFCLSSSLSHAGGERSVPHKATIFKERSDECDKDSGEVSYINARTPKNT